ILEHSVGLVFVLLSYQSGFEVLLVTEVDFVVSFIHLECAPFGCIGYLQVPIITNNEAHSIHFLPFPLIIRAGLRNSRACFMGSNTRKKLHTIAYARMGVLADCSSCGSDVK